MSTRLIVKGLPKHATETSVRAWFGDAVGEVTDARVMRTGDGRSRQFGFVGFATADKAAEAKRRFHGTFMDTSKLTIEIAKPRGDKEIPRAWSKYTEGSRRFKDPDEETAKAQEAERQKKKKEVEDVVKPAGQSTEFREFKELLKPRSKKNVWADDIPAVATEVLVKSKKFGGENTTLTRSHVVFGEGQHSSEDDKSSVSSEEYQDERKVPDEAAANSVRQSTANADVSDAEYFASKVSKRIDDHEHSSQLSEAESEVSSESDATSEDSDLPEKEAVVLNAEQSTAKSVKTYGVVDEDCSETGRLFIRNLSYTTAQDDLEQLFEKYGALAEVHLCLDRETKTSRGTAFIEYVVPENALLALESLDGTIFHGRLLHILPAKRKPDREKERDGQTDRRGTSSYKRKLEDRKKEDAKNSSDRDAWNTLFMRTDAVADVMAERMGVSKMEVYGTDAGQSGSAAVRLATGEAKLQQEARRVLQKEGVNVEAFRSGNVRLKRSKTIFVAKNLSKDVNFSDLKSLFAPFGALGRLVVVPSSLLAVVEFLEARDARRAYSALAYTRVGSSPLYLEWAPIDSFLDHAKQATDIKETNGPGLQADEDVSHSLFVKNLNFETTDEVFKHFFAKVGDVRSARVARKRSMKSNESSVGLSAGYGFVEFATRDQAKGAMRQLQGKMLDGHKLELKYSLRASSQPKETDKSVAKSTGKSAKLLVKNIAFEATVKDLRGVFAGFGQLKSARMPKKGSGQHRGYGFVEFGSKGEAAEALDTLRDTHLYGRHLVIDYAEEDPKSVDELMERAVKRSRAG